MNPNKNRTILALLVLILLFSGSVQANFNISLKNTDNTAHKLSEYIGNGQWVILNIWGTRCPPCREEMPELVRFHDEHSNSDAMVLAIAIDFPSYGYAKRDEVAQFAEDYLIDFPILLSDASITENMGLGRLEGLPTTFIFNPDGDIVGKQVGGITQKVLEDFIKKLKTDNHQTKTRKK